MGNTVELTAADGHRLAAYVAEPAGAPRGGVVVIQEIFGLNRHIREVAEQYAAAGFLVAAPALFDRVERDVDVPYTDSARGFSYVKKMTNEQAMLDVQAALDRVAAAGKRGVVGYCWGGTLAYLAAARLALDAAVSYYGGMTTQFLHEKPRCPVLYHFGERDTHIPAAAVAQIKAAHPEGTYYLYPAEHGFNCTHRASFEPASAQLALQRSIEFLHKYLG